jgi:hypothetical protein
MSDAGTAATAEARPSPGLRWHIVVGAIAIVYGALGTIAWLAMSVMTLAWRPMMSAAGMPDAPPPPAMMVTLATSAGLCCLGLLLVVAGVLLVLRKPLGYRLFGVWAFARLVVLVIELGVGFVLMNQQVDWTLAFARVQRDAMAAGGMDLSRIPEPTRADVEQQARWSVVGKAVVSAAFPIFGALLATSRRKREDVEAWAQLD